MLDIFSGLRLVVKRRSISIDNNIFRCHWFFTSTLLVSFSLIITARQYVGQPIECHSVNKIPDSLLNSYCWVQSTFTVPQACNQQVGLEVPYPCIDNARGREVKMFAYYQWVGMVLFVQGLLFHLPYYLWKVWENGLIKAITGGLRVAVLSDQERIKKRDIVVDYIQDHLGCHKSYARKYFLCELFCLLNLIAQLWATNKFFDGQFLRYGLEVIQYSSSTLSSQFGLTSSNNNQPPQPSGSSNSTATFSPATSSQQYSKFSNKQPARNQQTNNVIDPMTYIFPRITKCTYYDFGSSGDVQKHDALCLLPLNIINEKIYIALWFWFLILGFFTLVVIVYRLFAMVSESVRCKGLINRCKLSNELDIRVICKHCDVGDWFLFYMVAENLDPLIMREIVALVADRIRRHFEIKRKLTLTDGADLQQQLLRNQDATIMMPAAGELGDSSAIAQPPSSPEADGRLQTFGLAIGRSGRPSQPSICSNWQVTPSAPFSESFDSVPSTRRNSLADEAPLIKKIKKRLYNKRLWSADLGSGEFRQQLFGRQPSQNPELRYLQQQAPAVTPQQTSVHETTTTQLVSGPASSETALGLARAHLQRRTSSQSCRTGSSGSSALLWDLP